MAIALGLLLLFAKVRHLPGGLIVIIIGIAAGHCIDLHQFGIELVRIDCTAFANTYLARSLAY